MEMTVPHPYLGKEFIGYVLNTPFTEENQQKIKVLQAELVDNFGDAIWLPEPQWLHITLMDWIAPLVDYGRDKDEIFEEIFDNYDIALQGLLENIRPIEVKFDTIAISPEAIILIGRDSGQYQQIRQSFLDKIVLLPNAKKPPQIIHSTIARFIKEIDLQPVKDFAASQSISLTHLTNSFRLIKTTDTTMEPKKILKVYQLS